MVIEAVDRVMRGERAPSPTYEGEDGFIAWLLGAPAARYVVSLPEQGESKRGILDAYTKEHSADYQSQALVDLARRLGPKIGELSMVRSIVIYTSHHARHVIGTGSDDPEKLNQAASREMLDYSIMYIFAVVLEDGDWHHEKSNASNRANRETTISLLQKISTVEDAEWTKRYHGSNPKEKAFGGRVVVALRDGSVIEDEIAMAAADPFGERPFKRPDHIKRFRSLAEGVLSLSEQDRMIGAIDRLIELKPGELSDLTFVTDPKLISAPHQHGIFDWRGGARGESSRMA